MSLKAIELQIALPRTHDAGNMASQLQQRGQIVNEQANREMEKKLLQDRHNVNSLEQKDKAGLKNKDSVGAKERNQSGKARGRKSAAADPHPYKGNTIDVNG